MRLFRTDFLCFAPMVLDYARYGHITREEHELDQYILEVIHGYARAVPFLPAMVGLSLGDDVSP